MIDINIIFVNNTDLIEENSLTHLIEYLESIDEGEVNPIHHSNYYNNEEFMEAHKQIDQAIVKSNIYQKLKTDPDANPNNNYEIFSAVIIESKANHLPK